MERRERENLAKRRRMPPRVMFYSVLLSAVLLAGGAGRLMESGLLLRGMQAQIELEQQMQQRAPWCRPQRAAAAAAIAPVAAIDPAGAAAS